MVSVTTSKIFEALDLGEGDDIEFKKGRGGIGKSFMETVSAFSNTLGGTIVCGISSLDNDTKHDVIGLTNTKRYKENLWNALHDKNLISHSGCRKRDILVHDVDGKEVVSVFVPMADRRRRPVFAGKDVFKGTFKRRNSGDYHCDEDEIKQMLRDSANEFQDSTILEGTSLDDVDKETFARYRNVFRSAKPSHTSLGLSDQGLLSKLGGWKRDRNNGEEGLTYAGALMFGTDDVIVECFPGLFLDYFEKMSSDSSVRYDERVTSNDGDWVPNLFNFFYRVYPRLVEGLKTPFRLSADAMRDGETLFHQAIREALVNALVHTDYRCSGSIRIAKRQDAFSFQNPGRSLTPVERILEARHEGEELTDVRNNALLKMFFMPGLAERQGSGYPTIFKAWDEGKRHSPMVTEDLDRNLVSVTLPLLCQISPEIEQELSNIVGEEWSLLAGLDKDILVHAYQFGETSNEQIRFSHQLHSGEISKRLKYLSSRGWLLPQGEGRWRTYRFGGPRNIDLFGNGSTAPKNQSSPPKIGDSPPKTGDSPPKESDSSPKMDGTRLAELIDKIKGSPRVPRKEMQRAILAICCDTFLTASEISKMLGRKQVDKFRASHLTTMVKQGLLQTRHPLESRKPDQAYKVA